jgi:hypothetical protein
MASDCIRIPSDDDLRSRGAWRKSGGETYSAVRAHIMVVRRKENHSPKGPAALTIDLPARSEFQRERKIGTLVKYTEEISSSIQETVTSKLVEELLTKVGGEVGIGATGFPTAKLIAEVQARTGIELSNAVQSTLAVKKSYEQQVSNDFTYTLKYAPDGESARRQTTITLYPRLTHWRWEFYLHMVEVLTLRYRRNWRWKQVRDSIVDSTDTTFRPLFCVSLYEPQELSLTDEAYVPEVDDADQIRLEPLERPSTRNACGSGASFESLVKVAFPETKDEWAIAAKRAGGKKAAAKKAVAKKRPARKIAAKKHSAKKMVRKASKKTVKKASRKAARGRGGFGGMGPPSF